MTLSADAPKKLRICVNLHRFRHAAATFWSIRDPVNVRGSKDCLAKRRLDDRKALHMAQSRLAGVRCGVDEVPNDAGARPSGS